MATHTGSCQCGKIAYEFEGGPITEGMECNCSMCGKKGTILHFVGAADFNLTTPREEMATYRFNKKVIAHHFCPTCGVSPFGEGTGPDGKPMAAINLRCVDGIDPRALTLKLFDGAAR